LRGEVAMITMNECGLFGWTCAGELLLCAIPRPDINPCLKATCLALNGARKPVLLMIGDFWR